MKKLTEKSHALFMHYANDAGNWDGMPMIDGTKEERGNLTDLKKAGLITTQPDGDNKLVTWLIFTEKGKAYALENGVEITDWRDY